MKKFLQQYLVAIVIAIVGLALTFDLAIFIIVGQAIGLISLILFFVSIILDDKKDRGLFPSYVEGDLIEIAKQDPMASAMVVVVKNIVVIVVIILAYLFVKP